ncbi:arginine N-succinyltransferase [Roseateles violae]|uniref:Arginine N-succinyltransferase n=1 Tax=Roseateles violae TaxID=3058042 RepID=A0ABT8DP18_9BURK|nr:arginine N-succinyltransferase [Pelomonas sp. PFR6]MDN3920095.1 arginine N-succinyltransferase [Pelomonas sp. PFR6]
MKVVRTQLPADAAILAGWINQTGVPVKAEPCAGDIGFVLSESAGAPLACLRLRPRLGMELPRYSFHLGRVVHAAAELELFRVQQVLLLGNDHTGESELCDLACAPDLGDPERIAALSVLIEAALAHIRAHREDFGRTLVAELAGPSDAAGRSPFWRGLGGKFYSGDPLLAQSRFGDAWRSHLAALLPRQALYLSFLGEPAQAALGQIGALGQAAGQALQACGLRFAQHVRIDDGGPLLEMDL